MINSRKLEDLDPRVAEKARLHERLVERELSQQGIDMIFTSTLRDHASQNALYAQGRTVPGPGATKARPMGRTVTNAKGGQSWHNYALAYDIALVRHGKLLWDDTPEGRRIWQRVGELGEQAGLEWAGRWKTFKEMAHFQWTGGLTLNQLQAGQRP